MIETEGKPGPIIDTGGKVIGEHRGIQYYTVGQRKGLGIASAEPRYVIEIDPVKNAVIVGGKNDIYRDGCTASNLNWIATARLDAQMPVQAKIRSAHQEAPALISPQDNGNVRVKFDEPQMAITPGQAIVFYDGDTVVGGGIIEQVIKQEKELADGVSSRRM
ncbi:MAG: hypothetical protein PHR43_07615 [Dehalococcoidales bacterium]|nr:hypothetical protein [Dehalococcoidales bacterium]